MLQSVSICENLRNLAKRVDTLFETKRAGGLVAKPVQECFEAAVAPEAVGEVFVNDVHGVVEGPEDDGFVLGLEFEQVFDVVAICFVEHEVVGF